MVEYQRKTLIPLADVGVPGLLPADLLGLADESLADLPLAVGVEACAELGYLNTGFFPVGTPDPPGGVFVSTVQLRIATNDLGFLPTIEAAAAGMPLNEQIRFQYSSAFSRTMAVVVALQIASGLSEADFDDIFALAQTIDPT